MHLTVDRAVYETAEGAAKVSPVPLASLFSTMSPNEIAGFITAVIGAIYGVVMVVYLLRKWQREEALYQQSMEVLRKGSRRAIAEKINAVNF